MTTNNEWFIKWAKKKGISQDQIDDIVERNNKMEELGYDAITTVEEIKPPLRTSRDLEMYQMFGNPTKRKNTPSHSPKKEKADSHDD